MKGADGCRDRWSRLSRAWEESGQTQGEFCAVQGIELGTFRWWRWRLGGKKAKSSSRAVTLAPSPWVEVSRSASVGEAVVGDKSSGELRLVFCDGLELYIPKGFDSETLRDVLAVLGEVSC